LAIFIRSGDIRFQNGKVSEIEQNVACFCPPPIFLRGQTSKLLDNIYKLNMLPNTWQNFAKIGPRISEISRWKK